MRVSTEVPDITEREKQKPKLLEQVKTALRTRHYSIRTEDAYIHWIRRYILFHHKRHPKDMGEAEINQFLSHLAVKDNVSASTQNQALCAIVFLYTEVIKRDLGEFGNIVWAKNQNDCRWYLQKKRLAG